MTDDAVTNLRGEVETSAFVFHELHYTQALNVVPTNQPRANRPPKFPDVFLWPPKSLLAGVTEGSMPR